MDKESLTGISPGPEEKLVSYEEMMAGVKGQMEIVTADQELFSEFVARLTHGETNEELEILRTQQLEEFQDWFSGAVTRVVGERKATPILAHSVPIFGPEIEQGLYAKALMHYLVERDLVGPLIAHFAMSIHQWQQERKLPGVCVGMLRDFQPFYTALQVLGAKVEPWYLRRDMFAIDDELTPENEATIGVAHNGKLALWLEPLLIIEHVNLLDTGCWGTVVYDMAVFRSLVSWLSNSGMAQSLLNLRTSLRVDVFQTNLPQELVALLDTSLTYWEKYMKWGVAYAIIQDDVYLEKIASLAGKELTTSALDHYSHAWQDHRFPGLNHQMIYSHIDVVAGGVMPDPAFGEVVNDTIEENLASKSKAGPTQLLVDQDAVRALVERNPFFEEEILALAANKGAEDAVEVSQKKLQLGIPIDPEVTVAHMARLHLHAQQNGVYTGVLPDRTPTWSKGEQFLAEIWPTLANNPYSTFKSFHPEKGVCL